MVLAARFQLFTGNYYEGRRLARKVLESGRGGDSNTATVFEAEAMIIEQWCALEEAVLVGFILLHSTFVFISCLVQSPTGRLLRQ